VKTIIETERLLLRELNQIDTKDFFELNSNPEVMKYTGDIPFETLEEAAMFLDRYSDYERNGLGRWAVISKANQAFLGWCGLKRHDSGMVDIGFRFFQHEWGKGYATESAKATLEFGFNSLNIKEVIGRASQDNVASIRVLEKIKMQFWKYDDCEGIPNSAYYRLIKSQYSG
jgi:RimJ/RimL family protein N-acetyltransferase